MLTIISVNYFSNNLINKIEDKLLLFPANFNYEYIVVDNSGDFEALFESTVVLRAGGNVGFGRACNIGANLASGNTLLFLNPDVDFKINDVLKLYNIHKEEKGESIIGPLIRNKWGSVSVLIYDKHAYLCYKRVRKKIDITCNLKVEYISGAFMIVSSKVFQDLGCFPDHIFMYGEDLYLCLIASSRGIKVEMISCLEVFHEGGNSTSSKVAKYKRLIRSIRGHFNCFRLLKYSVVRSLANSIYLASGVSK